MQQGLYNLHCSLSVKRGTNVGQMLDRFTEKHFKRELQSNSVEHGPLNINFIQIRLENSLDNKNNSIESEVRVTS